MTPAARNPEPLVEAAQLAAMPNLGRCELVEGRIVNMTPTGLRHGQCEVNISARLRQHVTQAGLGVVVAGEVGILTRRNPDTVRGADIAFISRERCQQLDPDAAFLTVTPELVVEILSPSERWTDLMRKLREYFAAGVKWVWVADPESRLLYVYRSTSEVRELGESDILDGEEILPGFSSRVGDLLEG